MDPDFGATTQILQLDASGVPRILLVDDDELVLQRLAPLVGAAGFSVLTAGSAQAAIASLERDFTPVVITDLEMPHMDGLELCQALRTRTWPGCVYILLLTIQDGEEDILAGLDAGADDYLSKRASGAQLVARLRTAQRVLALEHSLKRALDEKRALALTDPLTGAHNRSYFTRQLGRELKRVLRSGGPLSLLSIDVDYFKRINDQFGHEAGDAVLRELVHRIGAALRRDTDWCARVGGEEFTAVLPETSLAGAREVAEQMCQLVAAAPIRLLAAEVNITVSIGVSSLEALSLDPPPSIESLMRQADRCLYKSKEQGRNRVTVPQEMR
jgi:diguanylate cyclase (GGDEF)-like protein